MKADWNILKNLCNENGEESEIAKQFRLLQLNERYDWFKEQLQVSKLFISFFHPLMDDLRSVDPDLILVFVRYVLTSRRNLN